MDTQKNIRGAVEAIRSGRAAQAAGILSGVLAQDSRNAQARWLLAQCHDQLQQPEKARLQLDWLLEHAAPDLESINRIAAYLHQRKHPLEPAIRAFRDHLERHPESANAAFNLAWYLHRDARFEEAADHYRHAIQLGVSAPEEAHLNVANLCMDHLYAYDEARQHLQQAIAINPGYAGAWHNLGSLEEKLGNRAAAARNFEKCLQLEPGNKTALARLADVHRFEKADDPLLRRLALAVESGGNSDLHYALGRAHDQLSEYNAAWRHLETANRIDAGVFPPYDAGAAEATMRGIAECCDREWLARFQGDSHPAVFICGLFRTGSTLVERILSAHPNFAAGGENEFFPLLAAKNFPAYPAGLDSLTPQQTVPWRERHAALAHKLAGPGGILTDKRPDNFLYAGLIKAILPSAKFIITERDWRDVATSIFATRLGPSQNYATKLENIRHYIRQHRLLVDHWQELLGADLVRVSYEDLVHSPRETIGGLLQALGVEWHDACLDFHRQEGAVNTASVWQVRQPLHAKSIGRWRNYESRFRAAFGTDLQP
jgi:tetratricopeptide (TPR) repeat protein/LPS sulfotransferase NodH